MTKEQLIASVKAGNLDAIADPATMLHLIEDPGAAWWWEGAWWGSRRLLRIYEAWFPNQENPAVFLAMQRWIVDAGNPPRSSEWECSLARVQAIGPSNQIMNALGSLHAPTYEQKARLGASLAVTLRPLVPWHPAGNASAERQIDLRDDVLEMLRLFAAP